MKDVIEKYQEGGYTIVKVTKYGKSKTKKIKGNHLNLIGLSKLNRVVDQLKKELRNEN